MAACLAALSLVAGGTLDAKGLDCALARQTVDPIEGDLRPAKPLLDALAVAHGLGLLDGWTFALLGGSGTRVVPAADAAAWSLGMRTYPLDTETGEPVTDRPGVLEIEDRFGQPWLVWHIDIADPCLGRVDLPVHSADAPVLRVDAAAYHRAIIEGFAPDVPRYPHERNEDLARHWDAARPILSSIFLSRQATTCVAGYETAEGPVTMTFSCQPMPGE